MRHLLSPRGRSITETGRRKDAGAGAPGCLKDCHGMTATLSANHQQIIIKLAKSFPTATENLATYFWSDETNALSIY